MPVSVSSPFILATRM